MSETLTLETPAVDIVTDAPALDTQIETPENGGEQPEAAPAKQDETPAWARRRFDELTGARRAAERENSSLKEELEETRRALAAARGEEVQTRHLTEDQIRAEERQRFDGQQSERAFGARTDVIASALAAAHGPDAVGRATSLLTERAGLDFTNTNHRSVIEDISDLPNSGDVYYALAHDPDAASAILDASPRRQYALLMDFAGKLKKPETQATQAAPAPQVSKAPAPVNAPTGAAKSGKRSIYDPNISPAEFDRLWKSGVRS
ncbi:hypothetical protein J2D73_19180 [Acetobacter sacchari]|uniref:Scaffolding protein n=1 Tax=Acetobacter sacchari TaxID=2661687 RepID=A0ABS3M195_9PROT|nr:hypothetical protein [Acetobacter sacchari]MBO1361909.1 hypothetical protein [Acetobacter sacchari]